MEKNKIYPQLTWRENINKTTLSKEKSPIRFYNIKTDEVEGAKETSVIEKYAILTPNGHKSLYKALQACKILKEVGLEINYLWSSEICIDQNNLKEEAEEVSKMRYYYNNTNVTLIAIHTELLEELSSSRFPKEGKSEQLLLDWPSIIKIQQYGLSTIQAMLVIGDYNSQDIVVLRLDEALRETKNRKRDIPVDAIYSILGLLPYGDKVEVKYKSRMCPECPNQEEVETCQHEEKNKNQPIYTKNDVESILIEVMKVAVQNGYGEPFA
ncbi:326_t:CDS:2 [Racocetra persica]|uniref:326_t:CDS:1 n=1 Tax=Racocetra persica TaxID=160502 RepID=A0ACA9M047_9GLOM|nr:326_t:CDS:2 [Racocetra persica]